MHKTIFTAVLAMTLSSSAFAMSSLPIAPADFLDDFLVSEALNRPLSNTINGKPCGLRVMNARQNPEIKYVTIAIQIPLVRNDLGVQIAPIMENGRRFNASSILMELNRPLTEREEPISTSYSYCTQLNGESVECSTSEAHILKTLTIKIDKFKISRVEFDAQGQVVSSQQVDCGSER